MVEKEKDGPSLHADKPPAPASNAAGSRAAIARRMASRFESPVKRLYQVRTSFVSGTFGKFGEILGEIVSGDRTARRMAWVFVFSVIGISVVVALGARRFWSFNGKSIMSIQSDRQDAHHLGEFIKRQAEEAKHRSSTLVIGTFTVALNEIPGQKAPRGVLHLAELELIAECDNKETRSYMENNIAKVRNQITSVFTTMDREELLSKDGKRKLRRQLLETLNHWLENTGKIEDLYFTKFILG